MNGKERTLLTKYAERLASVETKVDVHNVRAEKVDNKIDKIQDSLNELNKWIRSAFGNLNCQRNTQDLFWIKLGAKAIIVVMIGWALKKLFGVLTG